MNLPGAKLQPKQFVPRIGDAVIMFDTRISKSWGVGEGILASYLLESLSQDIKGGLLLFVARDKQTGRKVWLKASGGSEAAVKLLAAEAVAMQQIEHQNILSPCNVESATTGECLAFPWQGETPYAEYDQASLSQPDKLRIGLGLLAAVAFLQALAEPVVHNSIQLANLWLRPGLHWPLLVGFQAANTKPSNKDLAADRLACWQTIGQVCLGVEAGQQPDSQLETAAKAWVKSGTEKVPGIKVEMEREFLRRVTADL